MNAWILWYNDRNVCLTKPLSCFVVLKLKYYWRNGEAKLCLQQSQNNNTTNALPDFMTKILRALTQKEYAVNILTFYCNADHRWEF